MHDLLIAESSTLGTHHLLEVQVHGQQRFLQRLPHLLASQPCPIAAPMEPMDFPPELVLPIVIYLMEWYLQNRHFAQAQQLMQLNQLTLDHFYHRYIGVQGQFGKKKKIREMSKMMVMINYFNETYNEPDFNPGLDEVTCVKTHLTNKKFNVLRHQIPCPIDFYHNWTEFERNPFVLDVMQKPDLGFPFHTVKTGPTLYEQAMLTGKFGNKFFHCSRIQFPVFIIHPMNSFGELIIIPEDWEHYRQWKLFGDLLRSIYGPKTGVYLVVSDYDIATRQIIREIN